MSLCPIRTGKSGKSDSMALGEPDLQPLTAGPAGPAPQHVAVIMDGNGRWATARGLPRAAGHRAGAQAVRRTIEASIEAGVSWLTLYAFSSENWRRPADEVLELTGLLRHYIRQELAELSRQGVRVRVLGERTRFEPDTRAELDRAERTTLGNTRLNLNIALSYGARDEIAAAARAAAQAAVDGTLDPETLTVERFERFLSTAGMPDPDLMIRTSGEHRLSNFLLWQSAYAELVFLDVLWPDFGHAEFNDALIEFARRERRFGACSG
jgi:undecaprenyl diphosphate synthase